VFVRFFGECGTRGSIWQSPEPGLQFPPEIQRGTGMNSLNLLGAKSEKVIIFSDFLAGLD
jgi:hypothetical protein